MCPACPGSRPPPNFGPGSCTPSALDESCVCVCHSRVFDAHPHPCSPRPANSCFFIFSLPHSINSLLPPSSFPASLSKGRNEACSSDGKESSAEIPPETRLTRQRDPAVRLRPSYSKHPPLRPSPCPSSTTGQTTGPCIDAYASWSPALCTSLIFVDPSSVFNPPLGCAADSPPAF